MPHHPPHTTQLTNYQLDVLAWTAGGCTVQEVADNLGKTRSSVQSACYIIRQKLNARTITHAVAIAYQQHILTIE